MGEKQLGPANSITQTSRVHAAKLLRNKGILAPSNEIEKQNNLFTIFDKQINMVNEKAA